jgi:hypothetical protein
MKFLILAFILFLAVPAFSQDITIYKTFGSLTYERDTITLGVKQVLEIMKDNPTAFQEMKKAKRKMNISAILGFGGGILLVFPIGTLIAGGDPEWTLAAGGAAMIIASIPFYHSYQNHAVTAVEAFNQNKTSRVNLNIQFTGTGARLVLRF